MYWRLQFGYKLRAKHSCEQTQEAWRKQNAGTPRMRPWDSEIFDFYGNDSNTPNTSQSTDFYSLVENKQLYISIWCQSDSSVVFARSPTHVNHQCLKMLKEQCVWRQGRRVRPIIFFFYCPALHRYLIAICLPRTLLKHIYNLWPQKKYSGMAMRINWIDCNCVFVYVADMTVYRFYRNKINSLDKIKGFRLYVSKITMHITIFCFNWIQ